MRPRILGKAYHKVFELGKAFGKWIIKCLEYSGRSGPLP